MGFNTHKDLDIWQKSIDLVERIYKITDTFPHYRINAFTHYRIYAFRGLL